MRSNPSPLWAGLFASVLTACGASPPPVGGSSNGETGSATPLCDALGANQPVAAGEVHRWSFDEGFGPLPTAFSSVLGRWVVEAESTAPSPPNVARQTGTYAVGDYPRAMVRDLTFTDLTASVMCRPESGSIDQACGLVFRAQDGCNYYVVRANAKEGNTRIYISVDGVRTQLSATADTPLAAGTWHALGLTTKGSEFTVSLDGTQILTCSDTTFATGKIGLWTKSDSVTAFDDLEAVGN
ncbi:MAG: hypothetical protein JOZ69_22940 [Myxococcales bacterium]|nr:hypothetical protein [Myxococcales bacterium]